MKESDRAVLNRILLVGNGSEPKSLDPHTVTGVPENKIISTLLEGLINYHLTDDSLPEPGVASHWEHSADFRIWTFHLRENALWSDGSPVLASDFVYSFRRMLTADLGAEYANMLYILENGEAYHLGEISDFSEVGVKALENRLLQIRLRGPTPYFLSMLKHYSWFPVHPATIERFGGIAKRGSEWVRAENFVGNGPFVLKQWSVNNIIRVSKNLKYWDSGQVQLNEIYFFPWENNDTEERAFQGGQLHVTNSLNSNKIDYYRRERPDVLHIDPYLGSYFYRFNVTRWPLDNVLVRRALNLAVDRQILVDRVTLGGQIPAFGHTPDGMNGYQTPRVLTYDIEKARMLLAEAGFPHGKGFPVMEILYNTDEDHRKIAESIQQMWLKNLNIRFTLVNQEWKVYLDSQTNLDFDITRAGWIGDYMDPITFLDMWTTGNGNNDTGWSNRRFDQLIKMAGQANSVDDHFRLLRESEAILLEELPILPLYWYTRTYLLDPRVKGWHPKLLDNRPYKYVFFDKN